VAVLTPLQEKTIWGGGGSGLIAEIDEVTRTKGTFFTDFLRLFNKNFQKLSAVFARFQSAEKLTVSPCS